MSKSNDKIRRLKGLLRKERLENEQRFGRLVSKQWGGRPSAKEERRKNKTKLRKAVSQNDINNDEE